MERIKSLHPLAGNNATSAAALWKDPSAAAEGWDADQAPWKEKRRRVCLPLTNRIRSLLDGMTGDACVVRLGVLLEHAPDTRNPVTWVDCLAISAFGVFAIDQYEWIGKVARSANEEELLLHERPGVVCVQTSPLRRAKPVLRHLRGVLGQFLCPVESIAVFADSDCALDPTLPENMLQGGELRHFMRTRLNRFRCSHSRYLDPRRIAAHLQSHSPDWGQG
ncbi:NERD domain-containing protein [Paraburkholderia kirstenboschensis]|uniref:NERD domain-containing protein n=1 Tax=Paraburkholderia kirstenboschensis TaxID=1245436 RepID=A0ABZ0ENE6_9BURK|nr:NERD domain-containing protein [Paraburkholderia kirstenboschensis]WOD18686.1 NERD domain-containing protein [Paraburkholderia kirstenboschensis]